MYDESYLNEVVETQGELFGKVDEHVPEIDIYDFIEKYMNSKTIVRRGHTLIKDRRI